MDDELSPGRFEITALCQRQPGLNVLARGAGSVARRQKIDIVIFVRSLVVIAPPGY